MASGRSFGMIVPHQDDIVLNRMASQPRYVVFQLAEVAVPRALFAAILRRIDRL